MSPEGTIVPGKLSFQRKAIDSRKTYCPRGFMANKSGSCNTAVDDKYNMNPICEINGPLDLVFYIEASFNAHNYHLMFYSNIITALIEKFAYKLSGSTEAKIRVKTYNERNGKRILSEIWSIVNQQIRIVFIPVLL